MTDDWLKDAEEQRKQHQDETGFADAEREAGAKAFYEENKHQVAAILTDVGELWKSKDPHKMVLGVTTHVGHDFRVHIDKYGTPNGIELFLFDQTNMAAMHDRYARDGIYNFKEASLRVLMVDGAFIAYMTNGTGEWVNRDAKTLDDLKAAIAQMWAAGQIKASQ